MKTRVTLSVLLFATLLTRSVLADPGAVNENHTVQNVPVTADYETVVESLLNRTMAENRAVLQKISMDSLQDLNRRLANGKFLAAAVQGATRAFLSAEVDGADVLASLSVR
jgi:hypothetical protein